MSIRLTILGSGSGGNCSLLETDNTRILIDAGFSGKQIREKLAAIQRAPESLDGILVTHEHIDHIQGLKGLAGKSGLPVYCNRLTREAIAFDLKTPLNFKIFTTGSTFELGDLSIDVFSIPHDAQDPVGFMVRHASGSIGFATDLGHATKVVLERIRHADVLLLESNHDVKLLQADTKRPWSTKQRILGRHGHLSNESAAEVAREIMSDRLRHLFLGHLSRDCNTPEIALEVMSKALADLGATHVRLETTHQDQRNETVELT